MTNQKMDEFNRAKIRMTGDIKSVIADGEDLLKAAADLSGEGFEAARQKFENSLGSTRAMLAAESRSAIEKTKETAAVANRYMHDNPWPAIGVAAAAGLLIGFLATRR